MADMTVANTILEQLGGRRFIAMTGARNFVGTNDSLIFALPARFAKNGINKIVVRLMPTDTYSVDYYRMPARRRGDYTAPTLPAPMVSHEDIYADVLASTFASVTGLAVRL